MNKYTIIIGKGTLVGRHRTTVWWWLSEYRSGGLAQLLNIPTSPGRNREVPPAVEALQKAELRIATRVLQLKRSIFVHQTRFQVSPFLLCSRVLPRLLCEWKAKFAGASADGNYPPRLIALLQTY